jgi:deoxyribonuclease V
MQVKALHPWDLSPREAAMLQRELAARVRRSGDVREGEVRLIAGSDVAFDKPNGRAVGAVVVLAWPSLEVAEQVTVETPVTFPYVPGLLSFREAPALIPAFERLRLKPDLLMVDGHGYAHPRRFGFACHLGLLLDIPTIGVAKSRLTGVAGTVAGPRGARADVTDDGEVLGSMLRTRQGVRSIYLSVGHRISLAAAERWALACSTRYRVPEPTRLADRRAGDVKRRMLSATIEIVIEQRSGEPGRWEWIAADREVVYQHGDTPPMPAHYGCSTTMINPADNELLDVMLIDARRVPERGEHVAARVIDVLERADGDHKLLAVPVDTPLPLAEGVLGAERDRIWRWCVAIDKPAIGWGGEDAALALIRACSDSIGG